MTEQEKRIEKMGSDIEKLKCGKYHDCSSCDMKDYMFCQSAKLARDLYDEGYRKEEEVRKETATKFLFEAKRILAEYEHSIYGEMFIEVFVKLLQVSKEFGVEVDE